MFDLLYLGAGGHGANSGWRKAGILNTVSIWTLSIILFALLVASVSHAEAGNFSSFQTTLIFNGDCHTASVRNAVLHLFINALATLILASSNFFMQVLSAPTRTNVDKAHARARYLDIGVQSVKNVCHVGFWKLAMWVLLALSSVPLHLFFNSCVSESVASTDFVFAVASESILHGAKYALPGLVTQTPIFTSPIFAKDYQFFNIMLNDSITAIRTETPAWRNMTIKECMGLYTSPEKAFTTHRHILMIISNEGQDETIGWIPAEVLKGIDNHNCSNEDQGGNTAKLSSEAQERNGLNCSSGYNHTVNALWLVQNFQRSDVFIIYREQEKYTYSHNPIGSHFEEWDSMNRLTSALELDVDSGIITPDPNLFVESMGRLQAKYCLSEPFTPPCALKVNNPNLIVVVVFCLVKSASCLATVLMLRHHDPLLTPGDAVECFMARPDETTKGMCWVSKKPTFLARGSGWWAERARRERPRQWLSEPRPWRKSKHRVWAAVPRAVWVASYVLFYVIIGIVAYLLHSAWQKQDMSLSVFGASNVNFGQVSIPFGSLGETPMGGAVVANLPQVALSIAYLAYNGLFTRMLGEWEWSLLSVRYQGLRVSRPKGRQRSSYRLQLPYRWSIPLMATSGLLHWLVSNCIFVSLYVSYPAVPDSNGEYNGSEVETGIRFSTKAIFITIIISIALSIVPIILGFFRLPGEMVLAANNSAVISAACHSFPAETSEISDGESSEDLLRGADRHSGGSSESPRVKSTEQHLLYRMSTQKVKWGAVAGGHGTRDDPGHLAFGTEDQEVTPPTYGNYYAGAATT